MNKQRRILSVYFMWVTLLVGPCEVVMGYNDDDDRSARVPLLSRQLLAAYKHSFLLQVLSQQEPSEGSHGSIKFDEYGSIRPNLERSRLRDFATQLKAQPNTQAYIIAYGGSLSWLGEAKCRALRAKKYLAQRNGISLARIVIVNGGYREEATTALYIRLLGGEPPVAFPTLDPNRVRIIRNGRRIKKKCPSL